MTVLTRIALLNQSSAKFVTTTEAFFLQQLAEEKQDVDTIAIKLHQDGIAEERYLKYSEKISQLDSLLQKDEVKDK